MALPVRRFRVDHERDVGAFRQLVASASSAEQHSYLDELKWLDAEGPKSSSLLTYLSSAQADYDYVIFFSYRYYHAYHGVKRCRRARSSCRQPSATRRSGSESRLGSFVVCARSMYNSPEERRLIQAVSHNHDVPGVVVGIGSRDSGTAQSRSGFARSTESRAALRSMSGASIRTRAATSYSRSF